MYLARWLAQVFFIARLRSRMRVKVVTRGPVRFYGIDCTGDELLQLEGLDTSDILDVVNALRYEVGAVGRTPSLAVVCLGRAARLDQAPEAIRAYKQASFPAVCVPVRLCLQTRRSLICLSEFQVAVVSLGREESPIDCQIAHELTHVLLGALTDGFPYPYALQEGFAQAITAGLWITSPRTGHLRSARWRVHQRSDRSEHLTCKEVLEFKFPSPEEAPVAYGTAVLDVVSEHSLLLYCFLMQVGEQCPAVRRIFREIRVRGLRTPDAVYTWLQEASGMDAETLEKGFREYCTTGALPRVGNRKCGNGNRG